MSLSRSQVAFAMAIAFAIFFTIGVFRQFDAKERGCEAIGGVWGQNIGTFLLEGDRNCTLEGS